ncbi:MAG: LamB/YcsF family protein [Spirochaetaceae bacterium]|jgi:UPF0271 protein|nr:LamB/YcsF family protein [Spirochaetaceae bacterium]
MEKMMKITKIDLNCDLGESFGPWTMGLDTEIMPLISSANIACGFHAGDPLVMAKTVKAARDHGVAVGAHPGFPDLSGFGRRDMKVSGEEAKAYVQYQIGALKAFCDARKVPLAHVKPHGALYNMAARDPVLAEAVCRAIAEVDPGLILLALAGSEMIRAAEKQGIPVAREVFADRAYEEDGSLAARSKSGALITDEDEALDRVVGMVKEGRVRAITGKEITLTADSVCVHGDGPQALAFVQKINARFKAEGIAIVPLAEIIGTR